MKNRVLPLGLVLLLVFGLIVRTIAAQAGAPSSKPATPAASDVVSLTDLQLQAVKVVPAASRSFAAEADAVGYIDFNQDRSTPVFAPYQGVITDVLVSSGQDVKRGQALFTISSPDLVQAESTAIAAAGVLKLTTLTLTRAQQMASSQAAASKDVEQAVSDQQTAEGAYQAARKALRIFGKSEAEIDAIVRNRRTDGELTISSPLDGRVTARAAAPGTLAQPGNAPAPVTVSDLSTVWLVANVTESDLPSLQNGQPVTVAVGAYPGRHFAGTVNYIATALDPVSHRAVVRAVIPDPHHELHPQMLANFTITTGHPEPQVAVPENAVVREGDGSMTVYITQDRRRFQRRLVHLGSEQEGFYPVSDGLRAGELVATDGALFISNALSLQLGGGASDD